jgi:hypothetical protein
MKKTNYENSNLMFYIRQSFKNPFSQIKFHYSSTTEIESIINSLKKKDSAGYDEISTKILKLIAPYISSPLNHIFNKSLTLGIFPSHLKYSIIKPIFRKGDGNNMANYRPILLLTCFSKVFEKIICNSLSHHININILTNEQFGFRAKSSTEKASFQFITEILNALNNKYMVGGIFCDLEKAFDCVNHGILMNKLEFYGVTGKFFH